MPAFLASHGVKGNDLVKGSADNQVAFDELRCVFKGRFVFTLEPLQGAGMEMPGHLKLVDICSIYFIDGAELLA